MSPKLASDLTVLPSHTSTQEWQSFEGRMRQRRAERCLQRGGLALEAGHRDTAREALAEARALYPEHPGILELAARIDPSPARLVADRRREAPLWIAVAALVVLSAVTGWVWMRAPDWLEPGAVVVNTAEAPPLVVDPAPVVVDPVVPERVALLPLDADAEVPGRAPRDVVPEGAPVNSPPAAAVAAAPDVRSSERPAPDTRPREVAPQPAPRNPVASPSPPERPAGTTGIRTSAEPAARSAGPPPPLSAGPVATATVAGASPVATPPAPVDTAPNRTADSIAATPAARSAAPPPSLPQVPVGGAPIPADLDTVGMVPAPPAARRVTTPAPAGTPAAGTAAASAPAAGSGPLASAPVASTPPAVSAPPVPDERRVRAALDRYQMAYSRLDAAAARAVWPSVDRRALERAFGGLAAQSISLGECSVRVNGGSAQADCTGSARWTPRVGGGAQSATRRWRFDLQNAAGEWVIVDASVR